MYGWCNRYVPGPVLPDLPPPVYLRRQIQIDDLSTSTSQSDDGRMNPAAATLLMYNRVSLFIGTEGLLPREASPA